MNPPLLIKVRLLFLELVVITVSLLDRLLEGWSFSGVMNAARPLVDCNRDVLFVMVGFGCGVMRCDVM